MPCHPITLRWSFGRGIAGASAVHGLLVLLLLLWPTARKMPPETVESVSVEVVFQSVPMIARNLVPTAPPAQNQLSYPVVPLVPVLPEPALPPPSPPAPTTVRPELVTATRLFATAALSEPRNAQAREALGQLAGDEKAVQICNLEAMEQVARRQEDLLPDFVVAYATADIRLDGDVVIADGAALRSRRNWHALRYHCRVRADRKGVVAFSFALDGVIPRTRWREISLPAGSN